MLYLRRKRSRAPPLPSPPSDPILGHLRYMPEPDIRDTVFYEWGRKYAKRQLSRLWKKEAPPIVTVHLCPCSNGKQFISVHHGLHLKTPMQQLWMEDGVIIEELVKNGQRSAN
ncbi:hypothetical protein BC629DRAFT_1445224 [Irpex lacteus]|nr:hypothetical protein BC629DRAFT_1445224 [Irpex lacteus]